MRSETSRDEKTNGSGAAGKGQMVSDACDLEKSGESNFIQRLYLMMYILYVMSSP